MFIKQNYKISDENRHASKLCTSATECVPKSIEEKSIGDNIKVNHNAWVQRKKCMSTTCVKKCKNKKDHDD